MVVNSLTDMLAAFHLHHEAVQLLWQLLYTMGGIDNLRTARKYYASTIELSGGKNMRALYGVCLVCT